MKELYRHKDFSTVAYYKSILEAEGIPVMLRNESLQMSGLTEIPIPEFYPNICVIHDEDYPKAWEIMRRVMHSDAENAEKEITCATCGESNPGNFDLCYNCGSPLTEPES